MRTFQHKEWEYSLSVFEKLKNQKAYSERFRIEYAFHLINNRKFLKRAKAFLYYLSDFLYLTYTILKFQIFKPHRLEKISGNIFLISDSQVELQNLLPVISHAHQNSKDHLILCPAWCYDILKRKIPKELSGKLVIIQSLTDHKNVIRRAGNIISSVFKAIRDTLWFSTKKVKRSISFSTAFSRFAITDYYFRPILKKLMSKPASLIAVHDAWLWESIFFSVARERDIRSMVLQHGLTGDFNYPLFAEKFLTWGERDSNFMVQKNRALDTEVEMTGSPYMDSIRKGFSVNMDGAFELQNIIFLSQPFFRIPSISQEDYQKILLAFYGLGDMAVSKGKRLVIKPHPLDRKKYYATKPENVKWSHDTLLDALRSSCIAITVDSTSMLEAAMLKIPVIQITTPGMNRNNDFSATKICVQCDEQSLHDEVKYLLNDRSYYKNRIEESQNALSCFFHNLGSSLSKIDKLMV
jgi:hypothetical protein